MIKTSDRMYLAQKYINEGDSIIDVGCDHGYLGILALERGASYVEFSDNKVGPLSKAKENVIKYGYINENITFNLADGLTSPLKKTYDKVFILGMGGSLIKNILDNKVCTSKEYILSAHSDLYELRLYLMNNNYQIINEDIIYDKGKYYEFIIVKEIDYKEELSSDDLMFGPLLRKSRSDAFISKWTEVYNHYQNILTESKKDLTDIKDICKIIEKQLWQK